MVGECVLKREYLPFDHPAECGEIREFPCTPGEPQLIYNERHCAIAQRFPEAVALLTFTRNSRHEEPPERKARGGLCAQQLAPY